MKDKGFSMVELIIVIAIMAILVGVLAPQYLKYVEKAKIVADDDKAEALLDAAHTIIADEDYFDDLGNGDAIKFNTAGVTVDPANATIEAALDSYFSSWKDAYAKAKMHENYTYTIEFVKSGDSFYLTYGWIHN